MRVCICSVISTTARDIIHLSGGIIIGFRVVAHIAVGVHARQIALSGICREEDAGDGIVGARDVEGLGIFPF